MPQARFSRFRTASRDFLGNSSYSIRTSWKVNPRLFCAKAVNYIVQGLLPLLTAYIVGRLIDSIVHVLSGTETSMTPSFVLLGLSVLVSFVYNQSYRLQNYFDEKFSMHYILFLQSEMAKKFASLDSTYYEDGDFNRLVNKIQQNQNSVSNYSNQLFYLLASVVQLVASGITLLFLNPVITMVMLLGIWPVLKVEMRTAKRHWEYWNNTDADWRMQWNLRWALLDTRSIHELKIFQLPGYFIKLWRHFYARAQGQWVAIEKTASIQQTVASTFESGVELGINGWLLWRVLHGGLTLGRFQFYTRVISDFSNTASRMVVTVQNLTERGLYMKDFLELLSLEPRVKPAQKGLKLDRAVIPKIEFKNVRFKYPNTNKYVFDGLTMTINPGEDIAIVGENGAGKTTLIKLLMRFYDVTEGEILVNGVNLKELDFDSWYAQIGALFQDFTHYQYFKAKRNIALGDATKAGDLAAIKTAAKQAGAAKTIEKLPDKYDTVLSKSYRGGTELSGGEWQRIALSRAFLRNANILILDEPTAAIDAKGEYEIFQKIAKTQKDKTTIIISHRFSTVRNAHTIYVIEKGQIIEQGSHDELMKLSGGTYKQMFDLQAAGYR